MKTPRESRCRDSAVSPHAQRIDLVRSDERPGMERVHDHSREAAGADALSPGWHIWEATAARQPQIPPGRWDELVSATEGHVTQTAEWVEYALATDYERAVLLAGIGEGGAPHSVAVGFITVPRWPLRGLCGIRFPAYPSTRGNGGMLAEALALCERAARSRRCVGMEFLGTGPDEAGATAKSLGYTVRERAEYVFDLTRGEDALWEGLKRQHRKNVRRSAKKGVEVVRLQSLESVRTLRALQAEVAGRHAVKGDGFGLRPMGAYDALHRALIARGLGRVYCASVDGAPVSAALFLTFGRRAQSIYSGSNQQGLEAYGEYAMYWHALSELSREGFSEVQMGAADSTAEDPGSPAHGLHQFKAGFGARTRPMAAASKQLRPTALRAQRALRRVYSALGAVHAAPASQRAGGDA
jgi:hypothetical protein